MAERARAGAASTPRRSPTIQERGEDKLEASASPLASTAICPSPLALFPSIPSATERTRRRASVVLAATVIVWRRHHAVAVPRRPLLRPRQRTGAGEYHDERPELVFLFGSGEIPFVSGGHCCYKTVEGSS
jgi:hypothetical protein